MTNLPPEFQAFADFLDAQPGHVQIVFRYCLALVMVESGDAELVSSVPGETGAMCTFRTTAGDVFTLPRPPISEELEAEMLEELKDILGDEGL